LRVFPPIYKAKRRFKIPAPWYKPKKTHAGQQEANMKLTAQHEEYWRKNLVITSILLAIWFTVTFVLGWFSKELNGTTILGFPLGFYNAAQGALIVYVVLIWFYQHYMNKLDIEYGVHEGEDA
jgi:putative solute:sodium symporter small subunit